MQCRFFFIYTPSANFESANFLHKPYKSYCRIVALQAGYKTVWQLCNIPAAPPLPAIENKVQRLSITHEPSPPDEPDNTFLTQAKMDAPENLPDTSLQAKSGTWVAETAQVSWTVLYCWADKCN